MSSDETVTKNDETKRFELAVDGHVAYIEFDETPGIIDLITTKVPDELGGRGIGGRLAKAALAHAREQGLRVVPTCEFVQSYLERHPEERDVVESSG